jgi:MscS family membrane protein
MAVGGRPKRPPVITMMESVLTKTYYGNTVLHWLITFGVVVASVVVGRVIYWLIGKTVKRMAAKTRTHLDDILVDMLEEPFVLVVVILGIWYGVSLLNMTDDVRDSIDKIVYALLILAGAWTITRVFDALIREYLLPFAKKTESDLDDHLVPIVSKGLKLSIWAIALIMALDTAGIKVFSILAGLGIGGLAFALAAQHSVGNFFGSLAIFVDKPFKVGDRIQVRNHDGVVTAVGLRSTRIRTRYEGRIVTIPNLAVAEADVINVDTEGGRQIFAVYRLTPDMDEEKITQAMDLLKGIAQSDPDTQ